MLNSIRASDVSELYEIITSPCLYNNNLGGEYTVCGFEMVFHIGFSVKYVEIFQNGKIDFLRTQVLYNYYWVILWP